MIAGTVRCTVSIDGSPRARPNELSNSKAAAVACAVVAVTGLASMMNPPSVAEMPFADFILANGLLLATLGGVGVAASVAIGILSDTRSVFRASFHSFTLRGGRSLDDVRDLLRRLSAEYPGSDISASVRDDETRLGVMLPRGRQARDRFAAAAKRMGFELTNPK